jgi:tetratricopeptide (TPR) repeat protein
MLVRPALALEIVVAFVACGGLALGGCRSQPAQPDAGGSGAEARGGAASPQAQASRRRPREEEGRLEREVPPRELSDYDRAMIEGDAAIYSGRFDRAREQYLRAMELAPDRTSAALGALRTMAVAGHGEERAGIEQRIQLKIAEYRERPETIGASWLLSARLAIALLEAGEAIDRARLAVEKLPELGVAWRVLGEAAMINEQWGQAVDAFRRAAALGLGAQSGTWERLADALDEQGEQAQAAQAARRALELTGGDRHARRRRLNLLAAIEHHAGDLSAAQRAVDNALALGADDPATLHNVGVIAEARGDQEAALRNYRLALTQVPVPMTAWRMGHLLLELDRRQEALEAFTQAAAHLDRWTWPRSTRWWPAYDIGKLYAHASKLRDSIGWFEDALREARTARAIREVQSWLAFARVQSDPDAPMPQPPPLDPMEIP